jgi:hypothetical protein
MTWSVAFNHQTHWIMPRTAAALASSHIEEALRQVLVLDHRQLQGIALERGAEVGVHLATAHGVV